jgi:hypothetical protein
VRSFASYAEQIEDVPWPDRSSIQYAPPSSLYLRTFSAGIAEKARVCGSILLLTRTGDGDRIASLGETPGTILRSEYGAVPLLLVLKGGAVTRRMSRTNRQTEGDGPPSVSSRTPRYALVGRLHFVQIDCRRRAIASRRLGARPRNISG